LRYQQSSGKYSFYAHNFLLETLAELGLIGSVPLLFFLWVGIRKISIYLYKKKPENMRLLNVPIFGALALSLAYSMVDYSFNYLLIWLVFWAMFGLLSGSTDESHAK
jgi:O-antigen ligase